MGIMKRSLRGQIFWTFQWLKLRILATCLLILLSIVVPFVFPLISVIFIFRYFVFRTARFLRPSLGKILSSRSAMFACDDLYSKPLCTVMGQYSVEGTADIDKLRELIMEKWVKAKNPKTGELKRPELSQYITTWCGFTFWKDESKFDINQHVVLWEGEKERKSEFLTQSDVSKIITELSASPYQAKTSPWLMVIIPNFRESPKIAEQIGQNEKLSYMTVFKWHHALMDGFGVLKLFSDVTNIDLDSVPQSVKKSGDKIEKSDSKGSKRQKRRGGPLSLLWFVIRAPWECCKVVIESMDPIRENSWHLPEHQLKKQWKSEISDELIESSLIKEIKNHFQVSFTAVLMAAIAGSVRNFMVKAQPGRKIPQFIHAGIPFPMESNEKLRNSWSMVTLKLPIGGDSSAVDRLMYIESKLKSLKRMTTPLVTFLSMPLLGSLFNGIMKLVVKNRNTAMIVSTMPGPSKPITTMLGQDFLEVQFFVTLGPGNTGFGVSAFTYMDLTRISASVDLAFVTNPTQVSDLANGVLDHLKVLKSLMKSEV